MAYDGNQEEGNNSIHIEKQTDTEENLGTNPENNISCYRKIN